MVLSLMTCTRNGLIILYELIYIWVIYMIMYDLVYPLFPLFDSILGIRTKLEYCRTPTDEGTKDNNEVFRLY